VLKLLLSFFLLDPAVCHDPYFSSLHVIPHSEAKKASGERGTRGQTTGPIKSIKRGVNTYGWFPF